MIIFPTFPVRRVSTSHFPVATSQNLNTCLNVQQPLSPPGSTRSYTEWWAVGCRLWCLSPSCPASSLLIGWADLNIIHTELWACDSCCFLAPFLLCYAVLCVIESFITDPSLVPRLLFTLPHELELGLFTGLCLLTAFPDLITGLIYTMLDHYLSWSWTVPASGLQVPSLFSFTQS